MTVLIWGGGHVLVLCHNWSLCSPTSAFRALNCEILESLKCSLWLTGKCDKFILVIEQFQDGGVCVCVPGKMPVALQRAVCTDLESPSFLPGL